MDNDFGQDTLAVRAGIRRSQFNEHAEALYLTSSFVFDNAAQAAARFSGEEAGFVYGRFSNPTVSMLQERLAALEGGEACIATASGMAAILSTVMALMKAGEHIVTSQGIFGATQQLFGGILPKFGIETTFVASNDPAAFPMQYAWIAQIAHALSKQHLGNGSQAAFRTWAPLLPGLLLAFAPCRLLHHILLMRRGGKLSTAGSSGLHVLTLACVLVPA